MTTLQSKSPCPCCGSTSNSYVLSKNGYMLTRCNMCDLVYVNPIPSDEEIAIHYQQASYFNGNADQGYVNYADTEKALIPHFNRRLDEIEKHIKRGSLLDFGCAAGFFLKLARARGWQVEGVEISQEMAQSTQAILQIPVATTLDTVSTSSFDAITLWEVVEHLTNPLTTLRSLRDRLRPGGALMLSTPNNGHWQATREPNDWEAYRPPAHLLYFTQATLTNTLQCAGFQSVTVRKTAPLPPMPHSLWNLTRSLRHSLATGQARPWLLKLYAWRLIRGLSWGWQKLTYASDDIFTSLEAIAIKPAN